ncbi:metal-sensitive transcriptional regulator [Candidatus Daviesbacteria bacterium]|nr:metal-sensitive transcriptional regulator [Candidatus Daviesbacteria bacterium]
MGGYYIYMYRPKDTQERILHRLKIAQGHLKKVLNMVESGEYCIDVIHQSQAVQRALEEADSLVLENHLKTCASNAIKKGNQKEAISEIINVFKRQI